MGNDFKVGDIVRKKGDQTTKYRVTKLFAKEPRVQIQYSIDMSSRVRVDTSELELVRRS
jgi:hypothetical protein